MKDLETCRKEIDEIDEQIVSLFEKRMTISKDVVLYKLENNLPVFQQEREASLIKNNLERVNDPALKKYIKEFLQSNMRISKEYQKTFLPDYLNKNIVLVGIMGSGKTTLGYALSRELGQHVIDLDDYIVEKNQMSIPDMFKVSETYFREKETEACADMETQENVIISTGGGVVLKEENVASLKKNGIIFYIDRPISQIMEDVEISGRPLLKDGPEKLIELHQLRDDYYKNACDYHIINDGSIDECVEKILSIYRGLKTEVL